MCLFSNVSPRFVTKLINAGCGLDWTLEDMLQCGERGWNLKRVINNRLGLTRKNDKLPKAFLEPFQDDADGGRGFVPNIDAMLKAYYEVRGWDCDIGFPTREKLISLGLEWSING